MDSSGNAYVSGGTTSTNFPTTMGALQTAFGSGPEDAFVAKLNATGSALVYSTYLGGSGLDQGLSIAVDSSGNAYIGGATTSTNFPTANPVQASNAGGDDAFVAKVNTTGSALVYSTYLGGSGNDTGWAIAVDASGNAYTAGWTVSGDFPTVSPLQVSNAGGYDAFVAKIGLGPGGIILASRSSAGVQGSNSSGGPLNDDGCQVAFWSFATTLVPGDTNNRRDVFVHDRCTGVTTRESVSSAGNQATGDSGFPTISGNGRFVAFSSDATNLVAGDTNNLQDVFVRDRQTGTTTRLNVATDGTQGNNYADQPAISANGRFVAFSSGASNLVAVDSN